MAGLVAYFWVGFAICIYSTLSSLILGQIHESVIDNSSNSEVREKKKELKKIKNDSAQGVDNEAEAGKQETTAS